MSTDAIALAALVAGAAALWLTVGLLEHFIVAPLLRRMGVLNDHRD